MTKKYILTFDPPPGITNTFFPSLSNFFTKSFCTSPIPFKGTGICFAPNNEKT